MMTHIRLMIAAVLIAAPALLVNFASSCSDANEHTVKVAVADLWDCLSPDRAKVVSSVGAAVEVEIDHLLRSGPEPDTSAIVATVKSLAPDLEGCVLATVFERIATRPASLARGVMAPPALDPAKVRATFERIRVDKLGGARFLISPGATSGSA
jgi:hypothetical protein